MKRVSLLRRVFLIFFVLLFSYSFSYAEDPFEFGEEEGWEDDTFGEEITPPPAQPKQEQKGQKKTDITKKGAEKQQTPPQPTKKEEKVESQEELPDFGDVEVKKEKKETVKKEKKKEGQNKSSPSLETVQPEEQINTSEKMGITQRELPPMEPYSSLPKFELEPITPPATSAGEVNLKRIGPPALLITRPTYAPYSTEGKTTFIASISEAYFHFKLGAIPNIQVISEEKISNILPYFRDFTRRISRSSYIEAAKKLGSSFLLYTEYEPTKNKSVKFSYEVFSITENKKMAGEIKEIALKDFEDGLYEIVMEVATSLAGTLPKETQEFLAMEVMAGMGQIEALGNAIVEEGDYSKKASDKLLSEFDKLSRDKSYHLAKFAAIDVFLRTDKTDKAIALVRQLINTYGNMYPALQLKLAKSCRLGGLFDEAREAANRASNEPSLKLLAQIELGKIYEAEGQLVNAKSVYESVLSEGGEDGEIYFQLALVSIGLKELLMVDNYLQKATTAGFILTKDDYFDLGLKYETIGSKDKAIEAYRSALGIKMDFEEAWQKLAEAYLSAGREQDAAACYVNLFKINNNLYKDYLLKAGIMFENSGYLDDAKDAYALYIARRYDNPEAKVRLGKLEMRSGNCPKAIELVDGMDTTGTFGADVAEINIRCEKKERRVVIATGKRDNTWKLVLAWRLSSGVIGAAGGGAGYFFNNLAKEKYNEYRNANNLEEIDRLHNELQTLLLFRNLSYAVGIAGGTSLILSITLPIIF